MMLVLQTDAAPGAFDCCSTARSQLTCGAMTLDWRHTTWRTLIQVSRTSLPSTPDRGWAPSVELHASKPQYYIYNFMRHIGSHS